MMTTMKNYVIIDADAIQKRIEELEKEIDNKKIDVEVQRLIKHELKQILSQSTPLIPEIDKAYWAGMQFVGEDKGSPNEYIANLKLDI